MKFIKWVVVILLVIVVVALAVVVFRGGDLVKQGVNTVGPRVLGVPVHVDDAHFSPLKGQVRLTGLVVGNPEGFQTESLFDMPNLEVDFNLRSLLSDTIIIDRIYIDSPQITYEVGMRRTNLGTLLKDLEEKAEKDPEPDEEPLPDETGKQVVIKELILADARAQISATAAGGRTANVQLSTITLHDLGGEDQSLREIVTEVIGAVFGAVVNAIGDSGDLLGDGVKATVDGIEQLGGAARDGAESATERVGDGMQRGASRVSDMFGGSGDDEEEDSEEE